jgi:hypothetical protein
MYDHQYFSGCEEIAISTSQRIIGIETPDFAFRNDRVKFVPIQIAEVRGKPKSMQRYLGLPSDGERKACVIRVRHDDES